MREPVPADCRIGPLAAADLEEAAAVLAGAFRDNPLNVAVVGSDDPERRLRSNAHGTRALLPVAREHGFVLAARSAAGIAGVLIATPPGAYPLPAPRLPAKLRCLLGQGLGAVQRWGRVFEALDLLHPPTSHWYLGTLGVAPALHGRGVGSALLQRWLDHADRDGVIAYLETDRAENLGFYRRAGFEVVQETRVLDTRVWCMERDRSPG